MSNERTLVRGASKFLTEGQTVYLNCPNCGRKTKFGITKYADKTLYQCFSASCNTKGCIENTLSSEDMRKRLDKDYYPIVAKQEFSIPKYWIDGFINQEAIELAQKYDLMEPYRAGQFKTATDVKLMRQVFFYKDLKGDIVGASGRAIIRGLRKSYIYPASTKTPWLCGAFPEAVIVEDMLSAVKVCNVGLTGIALSGTHFQKDWIDYIRKFNKIYVALDKDATLKSFDIKDILTLYVKDVKILMLDKDFKDMSRDEARKVIDG